MSENRSCGMKSEMLAGKEEKHPLLTVLVDTDLEDDMMDGAMGGDSKDGGIKGAAAKLRAIKTKGRERAKSLAAGTVNIIKLWPDHLTTYTLTLSILILTIIILVNVSMYLMMTPGVDISKRMDRIKEECSRHKNMDLVFMKTEYRQPDAFLYMYINNGHERHMHMAKRNFVDLTRIYEKFHVTTLPLINDTTDYIYKHRNKRQKFQEDQSKYDSRGLLHPRPLSEFFENSPLEKSWYKFSYELVPFAVMVISLWEHGGLSVDLEKFNQSINQNMTDGFDEIGEFPNPLNIFDDGFKDDTLESEPNSFIHFNKIRVNNIQDIINLKTDENGTIQISENNTVVAGDSAKVNDLNHNETEITNNNLTESLNANQNTTTLAPKGNNSLPKHNVDKVAKELFSDHNYRNRWGRRRRDRSHLFPFLKIPKEDVVMISLDGMFISVTAPCHAFLGLLLQQLHVKTDYVTPRAVIEDALAIFCKKTNKVHKPCEGVEVIL